MMKRISGFTLVELMVIVALLSWIASFFVPRFLRGKMIEKRNECHRNLSSFFKAESEFFEAHQAYAGSIEELSWHPEGGLFRYRFVEPPTTVTFLFECVGNVDRDPTEERSVIDQSGQITQISDDMRN